jgi:hypothetical protein
MWISDYNYELTEYMENIRVYYVLWNLYFYKFRLNVYKVF